MYCQVHYELGEYPDHHLLPGLQIQRAQEGPCAVDLAVRMHLLSDFILMGRG